VTKAFLLPTTALCLLAGLLACRPASPSTSTAVLVAAGDIASCTSTGDEATAALLDNIHGTIAALGDNAYDSGTASEFANCYDPTWGRYKGRTKPAPGNHDYLTPGAAAYYSSFGAAAGDPSKGYYSYDLGAWHVIVLNSVCKAVVGDCVREGEEVQWLRADLAAHSKTCTIAYWHHPRFSSGLNGSDIYVDEFWQALYEYHADVVLNGHDHDYERFAPQDPSGHADSARGIREFVVGTGGDSHISFVSPVANSEVRDDQTYGVLKLTLHPASYDWQFIPIAGSTFTDSGSGTCIE